MERRCLLLLAAALAACGESTPLPPPVLTLLPAAFTGGTLRQRERCLRAGETAAATLNVASASVVFTVRGRVAGGAGLEVALGPRPLPPQQIPTDGEIEVTYRAAPELGRQTLRLSVPGSAGEVCVSQVAVSEP